MFDETDVFIINSCIKGIPLEKIAKTLGFNEAEMSMQLEKLKNLGINVYPGIKAYKIHDLDLKVYELLLSGLSIVDIAEYLKQEEKVISRSKQKIKLILVNKDDIKRDLCFEKENEEIAKYIEHGKKPKEIAELLGMKYSTVCFRIRQMKENNMFFPKKFHLDKKDESIIDCVEYGLCVKEIAEHTGLSAACVYRRINIMKKNGIKINWGRKKAFEFDEIDKKIIEGRLNQKKLDEIAKSVGLSRSGVSVRIQKLRKKGVKIAHGNVFRGERLKKVSEENLKKAIYGFIQSKKPSSEQLDEIIQYASETYKIDVEKVKKVAKHIDDDLEIQ